MDIEFVKTVLANARDQYDKAVRRTIILVSVLFAFHLLIYSPFLNAEKKLLKVEERLKILPEIQKAVAKLSGGLTKLSNKANTDLSKSLNDLFSGLRSDFTELSALVKRIQEGDKLYLSNSGARSDDEDLQKYQIDQVRDDDSNMPDVNMAVQAIPNISRPIEKKIPPEQRFGFDLSLVNKVRESTDLEALENILLPTIEEKIIVPRFKTLNLDWNDDILPSMEVRAKKIKIDLNNAKNLDISEKAQWSLIGTALDKTMRSAREIKFSPPKVKFWWETITSKGATIKEIGISVDKKLDQSVAIKAIGDDLNKTIIDIRNAETKLKQELERIQRSFDKFVDEQAGQLVGLPQQFGGLPIDIISMVSRFPLLIGLLISILLIWLTRRLKELIQAISLGKGQDQTGPIATWLLAKIKGNEVDQRKRKLTIIGFAIVALIWIGISSWELAGWSAVDRNEAILLFIISSVILTAGFVYYWVTIERELGALE